MSVTSQIRLPMSLPMLLQMGIHIEWPGRIFVDNAAGVSFQNGTNPNSKLKGIFDLREQWVKELRDKRRVKAVNH